MDLETLNKANQIIAKIEPLYEARSNIVDRIHEGRSFNLHESYFDMEFVDSLRSQIQSYVQRKINKLEKEFEAL